MDLDDEAQDENYVPINGGGELGAMPEADDDEPREMWNGWLGKKMVMRPSELARYGEEALADGSVGQRRLTSVRARSPIESHIQESGVRPRFLIWVPGMSLRVTGGRLTKALTLGSFTIWSGSVSALLAGARKSFLVSNWRANLPTGMRQDPGWYQAALRTTDPPQQVQQVWVRTVDASPAVQALIAGRDAEQARYDLAASGAAVGSAAYSDFILLGLPTEGSIAPQRPGWHMYVYQEPQRVAVPTQPAQAQRSMLRLPTSPIVGQTMAGVPEEAEPAAPSWSWSPEGGWQLR